MSKREKGKVIQYGNNLYIPIPRHVEKDSAYEEVNIRKGDLVNIEIIPSENTYRFSGLLVYKVLGNTAKPADKGNKKRK